MSITSPRLSLVGFQPVKLDNPNDIEHRREIARKVNDVLAGKLNTRGTVILTANAGTTTKTDSRVGATTRIHLMPTTANAAAALPTTYVSSRDQGSFVLTHANDAQTDKSFEYDVIG